ncbi:MAG TPA: 2-hydroxyacid dehydrogenase [Steroidobacteraceae bacterium]|jgi:phosphoglycerate dehydrogenase-like enzyme|nr:2-hydroxyacid dehydrogenase [Steroidobacteraceae bacterium]
MSAPMRIAVLDVAKAQEPRLGQLLEFAHEFAAPSAQRQRVDAIVALRFGKEEAARWSMPLLHLPGAGADAIDMSVLDPGCVVCNVFEHEVPMAEYVLAAVLDHTLRYSAMRREFDPDRWAECFASRRMHGEVSGRTLGLLGYGHIGKAVAERAKALGLRVLAISHSGNAPGADWASRPDELHRMLPQVDFLVIACPLTPQTRGMIGAAELALMRPSAVLINIGRGQVVEEEPLFRALESGRLAGATLDVWYEYPTPAAPDVRPARFPFERLPNVHCTAHSSAVTEGMFDRRLRFIADNLGRLRDALPLHNVIFRAP